MLEQQQPKWTKTLSELFGTSQKQLKNSKSRQGSKK